MVKAIIVESKDSNKTTTVFFCEDNKFYFVSSGNYVEFKVALETIKGVTVKFLPGMKERKELMEKLMTMDYRKAAKFYMNHQKSQKRNCKMFEGEFNGK